MYTSMISVKGTFCAIINAWLKASHIISPVGTRKTLSAIGLSVKVVDQSGSHRCQIQRTKKQERDGRKA